MNDFIGNDLCTEIIAQYINEVKEARGDSFSEDDINLAEIGRRTGISRGRLRRLKKNGFVLVPHGRTGQKSTHTVLSGFTSVLNNLLSLGITNSVVCLERLTEMGFTGSLSTVKRYIASHQDLIPAKRRLVAPQGNRGRRYKTHPGETYQMDWGFANAINPNGNEYRIACFAIVCHHCGQIYIEFFPNAKQECLFIGMLHAFYLMGVPKFILTDNMKSVVNKRDLEGHPIWNSEYEAFMNAVGFNTKLCKPRHPFIRKATVPVSFMPHSLASAGSVAEVTTQKYVNSVPLYRQEEIWKNLGIELSRATMSNWVIYGAENYLKPIADKLKERLLVRDILHVDETTVQVLKEDGKKPETKSYMWVYRSGNDGRKPIVIYDYKPSRDGEIPEEFLKDFKGYLHTDGYAGYNKVKGVTRCGCWAYLRRKFVEADTASKGEDGYAKTGIAYCDKLFYIEDQLKELPKEERYRKRLETEKPLIDEFWDWIYKTLPIVLPKTKLGKALAYAVNQKPYMENYLKDGRCSISNNVAENAIRPFTVGRKNWLFCDTPKGADASAIIYSIVETAKANGINVRDYLEYLFTVMPTEEWRKDPEILDSLTPCSPEIRKKFKN